MGCGVNISCVFVCKYEYKYEYGSVSGDAIALIDRARDEFYSRSGFWVLVRYRDRRFNSFETVSFFLVFFFLGGRVNVWYKGISPILRNFTWYVMLQYN